jgi:hypothetical protein
MIDLGVSHFTALSNGEFIGTPGYYCKTEKELVKLQQAAVLRKKGFVLDVHLP